MNRILLKSSIKFTKNFSEINLKNKWLFKKKIKEIRLKKNNSIDTMNIVHIQTHLLGRCLQACLLWVNTRTCGQTIQNTCWRLILQICLGNLLCCFLRGHVICFLQVLGWALTGLFIQIFARPFKFGPNVYLFKNSYEEGLCYSSSTCHPRYSQF